MPTQLPSTILTAAVRHKFYTIVDWTRCADLEKSVLERELAAVIEHVISADAPELQPVQRKELTAEILTETQELGFSELVSLRSRLKPEFSIVEQISNWLRQTLQRLAEQKHIREQLAKAQN